MAERRRTRSQRREEEEQAIQVKREEQGAVRQAQQRLARQQSSSKLQEPIHIDAAPSSPVPPALRDPLPAPTDELPPLEDAPAEDASSVVLEKLSELQTTEHMPPLVAAPAASALKKEESKEEQKDLAVKSESISRVKRQRGVKMEEKEERKESVQEERWSPSGVSSDDDQPISHRVARRLARRQPRRESSRPRRAASRDVRYAESSDEKHSDSDYVDDDSSADEEDDGEEEEAADDDDEEDEHEVIILSSDEEKQPPEADSNLDSSLSSFPASSSPASHLFTSTSPSAYIAPFLEFQPPPAIDFTKRYCLTLALSSRSRCRLCRDFIHTGYPRIGQHARIRSHLITRWYHPSCGVLALGKALRGDAGEQDEGRLATLAEYEELIERLNLRDAKRWQTMRDALQRRLQDIEEWKANGGVKRELDHKKKKKKKRKKMKKRKAKKAKPVDEEREDGASQSSERQVKQETLKTEGRVKEERGVKRERGMKPEVAAVKQERSDASSDDEKEQSTGVRSRKKVK